MKLKKTYIHFAVLLVSAVGYALLHYVVGREQFHILFPIYLVIFLTYAYLAFFNRPRLKHLFIGGVLLRLVFFFSPPSWSDDYHRFCWDGMLTKHGYSPYEYLPNEIRQVDFDFFKMYMPMYDNLNSQEYYSVYPTALQGLFVISAQIGRTPKGFVWTLRLLMILAECLTMVLMVSLLRNLEMLPELAGIYFLNPLIIIELNGNMHNEVFMILFVMAALWFFHKKSWLMSGFALALAVSCKLYPLMLAPLLFLKFGKGKWRFALSFVLGMILLFAPIIPYWPHIQESINLYYQKFEFNGGIYFFFRWLLRKLTLFNPIEFLGPILGLVGMCIIGVVYLRNMEKKSRSIFLDITWIMLAIYGLSTTVHPWYLSLMIAMVVFTRQRFAIIWSLLIVLSYYTYMSVPYKESYALVAFEWIAVMCWLAYETLSKRKKLELAE